MHRQGLNTLIDYPLPAAFQGPKIGHATAWAPNRQRRRAATTKVLKVPPRHGDLSTEDGETLIADLTEVPASASSCASGGNGGFGNAYFKTSTNQAPRHANPGLTGDRDAGSGCG
jgi:GTP-binding protein